RLPQRRLEGRQPHARRGTTRALPLSRRGAPRVVGGAADGSVPRVRGDAGRRWHGAPMNFLAHFLVAENDEELRLGSLLGDVVKGRVERYDHSGTTEGIWAGI